ncbi:hypothetical protein HD599_003221 [Conyzicola lurida]|uniref:Uncharacterized protein n=1 Tax=Conyzicola lurida TaxID=1172621 RepID=A0A841ARH1_9MICO|nr:hypothetical protein [Conyzicola lurida]MBB5844898.1 hypothetical protein [Conyzicola lurida]
MSEETETLQQLEASRSLELIRWVGRWVFWRVNKDFDPDAGHDQAVIGLLAYKYSCDLFDRLAAAGKYKLPQGETVERGFDLLATGLNPDAFNEFLVLDRSQIQRNDYAGSPAWSVGNVRWVLQSMPYGEVDRINWNDKSETKQTVGRQHFDYGHATLWEAGDDEFELAHDFGVPFDGTTFVLAHGFDGERGDYEIYFGRSRASDQPGDGSWHWRKLVAQGGFGSPDRPADELTDLLPGTPPVPIAPDASVRLRSQATTERSAAQE